MSSQRHPSERRAAWWYRCRGYRVLGRNVWVGGYELDLIVRRGRTIACVEVKSKSGSRFGDPLEMVTPVKVGRLRRAAHVSEPLVEPSEQHLGGIRDEGAAAMVVEGEGRIAESDCEYVNGKPEIIPQNGNERIDA